MTNLPYRLMDVWDYCPIGNGTPDKTASYGGD